MTDIGSTNDSTTRRTFLTGTTAVAAALLASAGCSDTMKRVARAKACPLIDPGGVVLFQGDSITDAGRDRKREDNANDARAMGRGYALLAAAQLLADHRDPAMKIYNRGNSGNKVFQLADRWDKDCLALKPNIVSILIGVNDIWHKLGGRYDGTVEVYERDYRALLKRTRQELPKVKLVVCEPFVLRCGAVNETWFPEFDGYRAAAKAVAEAFDAIFVPFQSVFDQAIQTTPPAYWAGDGVHPTMAGAQVMAQAWLTTVSKA